MRAAGVPLGEYIAHQVKNLCDVLEIDENGPLETIDMLLGPAYFRPISEPPLWPSDVADDETPVELSFTLDDDAGPRMRILGEPLATNPGPTSNLHAALQLLGALSERYAPSLNRFDAVSDLFLPGEPQGKFSLWFSFIFAPDSREPTLKIYFNPNARGRPRRTGWSPRHWSGSGSPERSTASPNTASPAETWTGSRSSRSTSNPAREPG
ncbi:tryptophan dimethylallyltransferase family protein [Saccharopolyspora spinosporotrichia]